MEDVKLQPIGILRVIIHARMKQPAQVRTNLVRRLDTKESYLKLPVPKVQKL